LRSEALKKVIVDANVIIKLHELGKFESLLKVCEVYVTETIKDEARFYLQDLGNGVPRKVMIDLDGYIRKGRLKVLRDPPMDKIAEFSARLEKKLPDKGIQLGETSCLIHLEESGSDYYFCTGDRAVMFVAGYMGFGDRLISLEALLGMITGLEYSYTEDCLKKEIERGSIRKIQEGAG